MQLTDFVLGGHGSFRSRATRINAGHRAGLATRMVPLRREGLRWRIAFHWSGPIRVAVHGLFGGIVRQSVPDSMMEDASMTVASAYGISMLS